MLCAHQVPAHYSGRPCGMRSSMDASVASPWSNPPSLRRTALPAIAVTDRAELIVERRPAGHGLPLMERIRPSGEPSPPDQGAATAARQEAQADTENPCRAAGI